MRIRTIKPEFYQSESIGRLSRDARSLFVGLFSLADDEGRFRANHRLITASLFPYDADALGLMPCWLAELEREGCVQLYVAGGNSYGHVVKWKDHQKIDKPSASKLPQPPTVQNQTPRILANPRESSCEDQGSGSGSGIKGEEAKTASSLLKIRGALESTYREATGGAVYGWSPKSDDKALDALLLKALDSEEVVARWDIALRSRKKFPVIHTLSELEQHWNHFPVKKRAATEPLELLENVGGPSG